MIPGLESIPESDFLHFSEIYYSDSNSDSGEKIDFFLLYWNRFRVLESIPKSDIYHCFDSDSNSDSRKNGIITPLSVTL